MKDANKTLANNIKQLIRQKGLTLKEATTKSRIQ